ncbi:GGDEF domain-containing protein [Paenibacillus sp. CAA11]|uniref:putative bifunctional diguanylate cyclase/phosphodiesterase n=1 Tax=Paenibacillus sp. CAA11 TaxID=1532905 RepID=UPI000D3A0AE9|nr:bifunctional diguanylate cyclase/phosphodiesterase [Paenibacillus sp. CAA11]AWB45174.1 GGDEF domain-containing protein [Paenibacillus sp. CAA11]
MNKPLNTKDLKAVIDSNSLWQAIDHMGVGVVITDPNLKDNPVVYVNQGFTAITGYTSEEVLLKNCRFLQGAETDQEHLETIRRSVKEQQATTITIKNYKKDGSYFWNQLIMSPIYASDGRLQFFIGLQFDVTKDVEEKKEVRSQIAHLSTYDPVTGLLSLAHFRSELEQKLSLGSRCAVIRVNVNRFRYINESYGEDTGDRLLIEIAERMKRVLGPDTQLCRSFADDFILLLSDPKNSSELQTAAMLSDSLREPYNLGGEEIHVSFSLGVSIYPEHGETGALLLKHAELAMKQAKSEGLGQPLLFEYSLMDRLLDRMRIEKRLPVALDKGEFELHFQPKIMASSQKLIGAEALVRWYDPVHGLVSPMEFIPLAEENGFIIPLGQWVLEEACRQAKAWQDAGYTPFPVSVNVSAVQIKHPQFIHTVERALEITGLSPEFLELEVTETIFNDPVVIKDKLNKLKSRGISISIDDFGTGYSSIHYLKTLPIDILKIDKAFIENTPGSEQDNSLLRSIIQLGKSFGLTVLVEGVETKEQFDFLSGNGCDLIQGYYYSRPLNLSGMEELLRTLKPA